MRHASILFPGFDSVLLQFILQKTKIVNHGKMVFAQIMLLMSRYEVYRFLRNDFTHSYLKIVELYRKRWQVNCFKWIKQLHINSFYGTSQNALHSLIWIAICNYLLLAIAKKVCLVDQDLYFLSAAIGEVLF